MSDYRQYENPWILEERLKEARSSLEESIRKYGFESEASISIAEDVHDLECRVKLAWLDNEYENDCFAY